MVLRDRLSPAIAIGLFVAVASLFLVVGVLLGRQLKSPADLAAEADPPQPSRITAEIERRVLEARLVFRGSVVATNQAEISANRIAGGESVVTASPVRIGDTVNEGDVVLEVSGRPVFVLEGELPPYRNLAVGAEGPDVRQLETALARIGYLESSEVDDSYTLATASAVESMFSSAGYQPDGPVDSEAASRAAQLRETIDALENVVADARTPLKGSTLLELRSSVTQAQNRLSAAELDSKTAVDDAKRAEAEHREALDSATTALEAAGQALREEEARAGGEETERVMELRAANDAASIAHAAAVDAHGAAVDAVTVAEAARNAEVGAAKDELAIAEARLQEAQQPVDVSDEAAELVTLRAELTSVEAQLEANLLRSSIEFVPHLPAEVRSTTVSIGATGRDNASLTLGGSASVVLSLIPRIDAELVSIGDRVLIEDTALGLREEGTVLSIGEDASAGDIDEVALVVEPLQPLPPEVLGLSLRVSATVSSTDGEVLVAPVSAVSSDSYGQSRLRVVSADSGSDRGFVEIETGLVSDGFVEILGSSERLVEGQTVVVGVEAIDVSDE